MYSIIFGYLWYVLGINYTPVHDGWVSVSTYDGADSAKKMYNIFINVFLLVDNNRWFRNIPYALVSQMPGRTILYAIYVMTGLGLYLVISKYLNGKMLLSVLASLFIIIYPYDGTLFWLGALGVNLGFLLCIYSLLFFILSVEKRSAIYLFFSLVILKFNADLMEKLMHGRYPPGGGSFWLEYRGGQKFVSVAP